MYLIIEMVQIKLRRYCYLNLNRLLKDAKKHGTGF